MDLSREAILKMVRERPVPVRLLTAIIAATDPRERRLEDDAMIAGISEPERLALLCISHGMTDAMTAETLDKALETIKSQLKSARHVLEAKNTTHAVAIALRRGLIE